VRSPATIAPALEYQRKSQGHAPELFHCFSPACPLLPGIAEDAADLPEPVVDLAPLLSGRSSGSAQGLGPKIDLGSERERWLVIGFVLRTYVE